MAIYNLRSSWSFTDGRDGSVLDGTSIEAVSAESAIAQAQAYPPPNLPVVLRTMLLTDENDRIVWSAGGPLDPGASYEFD